MARSSFSEEMCVGERGESRPCSKGSLSLLYAVVELCESGVCVPFLKKIG